MKPKKNTTFTYGHFPIGEIEKIADEFAIGFGEWMINNAEKYNEWLYQIQDLKELLEIYKKQIK